MQAKKILTLLTAILSLSLADAQAKIGWTYEQCVAHWGKETDRLILQQEFEDGRNIEFTPLFIFHYGKRYISVEFSHYTFDDDIEKHPIKVIKEQITNQSGL